MAAKVSAALPSFMGDMPTASYLLLLICLRREEGVAEREEESYRVLNKRKLPRNHTFSKA